MWRSTSRGNVSSSPSAIATESFSGITSGLADVYRKHVLPLERDYRFAQFYSPNLTDGDFGAKPMILLIGQYSTGKTTFVKHLLEKDYPGLRIGPEPTTDKFVAVCHNDQSDGGKTDYRPPAQVLPGHAAVVDQSLPWSQLESFGPGFLSRFEVVHVSSPVFRGVTLIDTPGVLAGNKQWERGYDFEGVIKWFAERVDLVLLFFDAHKLDISDEFRRCILALKGFESKVCILLNKADSVSAQQLMRVYGALMWSLGKVMLAPEVPRIYIGSFWDQPLQNIESRALFEAETDDLYNLIYSLPARSAARKIDDFLKRVRLCRTHCILMNHLRKQMPYLGKSAKQRELINTLPAIYEELAKEYQLPVTDFPDLEEFKKKLATLTDINKFPKLEQKRIKELMDTVKNRVSLLTHLIPREEARGYSSCRGVSNLMQSPFFSESPDLIQLRNVPAPARLVLEPELQMLNIPPWAFKKYLIVPPSVEDYRLQFMSLNPDPQTNLISGIQIKSHLEETNLPTAVLHRIWNLADVTKDGYLNLYEYALARHFCDMKLAGLELPPFLPRCLQRPPEYPPILENWAGESSSRLHHEHSAGSQAKSRDDGDDTILSNDEDHGIIMMDGTY